MPEQSKLEQIFESLLWKSRFMVLIAVIFGVLGATTLFIKGTIDLVNAVRFNLLLTTPASTKAIMAGIIGSIDLYLIGIVVLLFSFGLYELFISKIDIAHKDENRHNILEIKDLDELKNKILKVIIMVLVVSFFKQVLEIHFESAQEMLYLAFSILALAATTYLLKKIDILK